MGESKPGLQAWFVVALAACTQAVSQVEQAVVGLAAEPIMRDLSLTSAEYGLVAGSLYALYAIGGIAIGFYAAPRFSPRTILIALLLCWSLSQLPILLASSVIVLVACRVVLGATGGGGTATSMNACYEWFPDGRRALPGALLMIGGTIGSMLTAPGLTYIIVHYGWRQAFLACSLFGLVVMAGWLLIRRDGPYAAEEKPSLEMNKSTVLLLRMLSDKTMVGNAVVGLCAYWIIGFMVAWLAPYARDQGGLSVMSSGWALSAIFLGQSVVVVCVAGLSQWLLAHGYSSRVSRSYVMAACLFSAALCFVGMAFVSAGAMKLIFITLATGLAGAVFPLSAAMISEVAPPSERYRLVTIIFALVTLSALVSPGIAGAFIELGRPDGWRVALLQIAGVATLGGILALRLLFPEKTVMDLAADNADTANAIGN